MIRGLQAGSIVAFGISVLLFSGALQVHQEEHEANALRTAAPAQYQSNVLLNCDMAAFTNSAKRAELVGFCSRMLIQTAFLQVSASLALLDAIELADWRATRSLFNAVVGAHRHNPRQTIRLAFIPNRLI
jgi:hypothetical protein